jgi:hypothetical protein
MSRYSCLECRAENLPNAIACVACGAPLFAAARGAWPSAVDLVPPAPIEVPPRPDRDDA